MQPSRSASVRRIRFVEGPSDWLPAHDLTVVVDTAWTPSVAGPTDLVAVNRYVASVVEHHDLFAETLSILDDWAAKSSVADALVLEGHTYWFRVREEMWHWAQERLLWRYVLDQVDSHRDFGFASVPDTELALLDVAKAAGYVVEHARQSSSERPPVGRVSERRIAKLLPTTLRRAVRRVFPRPETVAAGLRASRHRLQDERLRRLTSEQKPIALVLSAANIYQRIGFTEGARPRDPNLGSIITAIRQAGIQPIVVAGGLDVARSDDWELVEDNDDMVSSDFVAGRWGGTEDEIRAADAVADMAARIAALARVPFVLADVDVTDAFLGALRRLVERTARDDFRQFELAVRMIDDLRPRALLMTHEGHRVPWLIATARAGVPTFTVQHGILYKAHPGYPNWRHPTVVLPTRTFVFGDYERQALLAGAYRADEVVVAGSPRLDVIDAPADAAAIQQERRALRAELGVADNAKMLVISTISLPFMQRFHFVHMLARVLGGNLAGVHLIFKQHPSETDEGPYRRFLEGLAAVGGYAPPAITVVRDVDLHRLLRAADAHLGQISTVLTDAVVDGVPNLIATVEPGGDILGYVRAGVARPVRNVEELRAALDEAVRPDPEARRAFLDEHFREGRAGERIAMAIADVVFNRTVGTRV